MRPFLSLASVLAAAVIGVAASGTAVQHAPRTTSLVALGARSGPVEQGALRSAGAQLVDAHLRLWRLDAADGAVVQGLRADGMVRFVQPVRSYAPLAVTATQVEPLATDEWWRAEIGVTGLVAPGPGIPITIVDSGVDFGHPEFAGRSNLIALNVQDPQPLGGRHGTMVGSLIGASENAVGFSGIYPQAVLKSWDSAEGTQSLDTTEIVNGILAAARSGKGVINLSLGGPRDLAIELAVEEAVSLGSLVVAASGNDGDSGNPLGFPAALPRVLTVAATGRDGQVAAFSSSSPYVDLAAPGDQVLVAESNLVGGQPERSWGFESGTSFAAPLVSGAAAWLWTVRPELAADQVAEVLRRSARDIGAPGRDPFSGFGLLDVAAALAYPAPIPDTREPNDDVDNVDPDGDRNFSRPPPLTTKTLRRATLTARVDRWEDPSDVYRVWVPARMSLTAVTTGADTDLALFRVGVPSVSSRFVGEYRLARARTRAATERLVFANGRSGRWAYLVVTPGRSAVDATYRLSVTVR